MHDHDHTHSHHGHDHARPRLRRVPELLAPAGGPEAFDAALAAGADAIFCGFGNDRRSRRPVARRIWPAPACT